MMLAHGTDSPTQQFDLLSPCHEWGLRSFALDFIESDLDYFWQLSTLHTQLKCLGKVSTDPMCGPSTHQTTPLLLQPHMPAAPATRASLPELSPLEPATDMRVMWETWRARREPATCNITGHINHVSVKTSKNTFLCHIPDSLFRFTCVILRQVSCFSF